MKQKISILLCALLLCTSLLACSTYTNNSKTIIRLSEVTHSIFYAPLYVAINKGYFEEENIKIELTNGGGADKVMTALTSNSADIGLMGPEATIYVKAQGRNNHPVIFGQLTKRDGSFLISKTKEPNFKWENLTNKRILAGRKGGSPAMTLQYVLNSKGLYHNQNINIDTTVAFNMMGPVFESDPTVHYTTLFEPTASEYVNNNKGYIVASIGNESGEVPYTAFSATKNYIQDNENTILKFLKAIIKAYGFMTASTVETVAEYLKPSFSTTPTKDIINSIKSYLEIDAWSSTPVMTKGSFQRLQAIMSNAGELITQVKFEDIVDNSYATKVLSQFN